MTKEEWRVLISAADDAGVNLAVDEALIRETVDHAAPGTIRIWQNHPSVIIGRSQDAQAEVNTAVCRRLGIPVLRRFSGGGAVYTDQGCFNYSVVTRSDAIPGPKTLSTAYRFICSAIMNAISDLGLRPLFVPPSSIFVQGHKVSGSAQYLLRDCLLQHGTLLVNSNLDVMQLALSRVSSMPAVSHFVPSIRAPVANLSELIGRHVSQKEILDVMIHELTSLFGQPWKLGSLSRSESDMTRRLLSRDCSSFTEGAA